MNGHDGYAAPATSYFERFEAFRQSDREREAFVADLVQKYQDLQSRYQEKCGDYENEVESRRIWHSAAKARETELLTMRQASVSCITEWRAYKANGFSREVIHLLWLYSTAMAQ
jgi:hypothetical protein